MRVVAGTARGRRLEPVPGDTTRPITDRAKEALFSILAPDVPGATVLDLFAGTGAVGIEALSRGAAACTFVEMEKRATDTIERNLTQTRLADRGTVVRADVFRYLTRTPQPHDIVYVAPPQYRGLWQRALAQIDSQVEWVVPGGVVIAQMHPREEEHDAFRMLHVADRRRYGSVLLLFMRRSG